MKWESICDPIKADGLITLEFLSTPNIYKTHHFGVNFDMIAYNSSDITLQYGWKDT